MKLFLSIFLFLLFTTASAQNEHGRLKAQLLSADSVIIVSHKPTAGFVLVDDETGKELPIPPLIVDERLNDVIIQERKEIKDSALEGLIMILTRPSQDRKIEIAKCFIPHNAIVFFKRSKASYIDICFGCRGIETSGDIQFSSMDIDNRKWEELENFFIQNGIKYEFDLGGILEDE